MQFQLKVFALACALAATMVHSSAYAQGADATAWGIFVPVGTPQPVVDKLNAALRKITTSASFGVAMRKQSNEPNSSTPLELREVTLKKSRTWAALIKRLNIKAE